MERGSGRNQKSMNGKRTVQEVRRKVFLFLHSERNILSLISNYEWLKVAQIKSRLRHLHHISFNCKPFFYCYYFLEKTLTENIIFSGASQPLSVPEPAGSSGCGTATVKAPEPLSRSEIPGSGSRQGWSKMGSFYLPATLALISRAKVRLDFEKECHSFNAIIYTEHHGSV